MNAKIPPDLLLSNVIGIGGCENTENKRYGVRYTVNSSTWDYFYDGGGGTSFDYCLITIRYAGGSNVFTDLEDNYCKNTSRFNRTSFDDFADDCSIDSPWKNLLPDTDYEIKISRPLFGESGWYEFTTPTAASLTCGAS